MGDCTAVDGHEGIGGSWAGAMDCACHRLLARPAFAFYQYRNRTNSLPLRLFDDTLHYRTSMNNIREFSTSVSYSLRHFRDALVRLLQYLRNELSRDIKRDVGFLDARFG